jgi:hypothetical protein
VTVGDAVAVAVGRTVAVAVGTVVSVGVVVAVASRVAVAVAATTVGVEVGRWPLSSSSPQPDKMTASNAAPSKGSERLCMNPP